jgi:hypothetical protein
MCCPRIGRSVSFRVDGKFPAGQWATERKRLRQIADVLGRTPNGTLEDRDSGDILNPYQHRLKFITTIDSVEAFKKRFEAISECTPKLRGEGKSVITDFVDYLLTAGGKVDLNPGNTRTKVKRVWDAMRDTGQNYVTYACRFPPPDGAEYVVTYVIILGGDALYEYDGVPIRPGFVSI